MKKTSLKIGVLIILLAGIVLSCFSFFVFSKKKEEIPLIYIDALNSSGDGYGYDLGRGIKEYHPMASALIVSAEANRYFNTKDKVALKRMVQNVDWLVDNKDIDNDGIIGWGVPYAWDAFGDGSENPAHTEYTITTALVVKSFLDAIDAINESDIITELIYRNKKNTYLRIAQEAIDSFIENKFYAQNPNEAIFFWYSSQKSDNYFVVNCHAMFVGVLQRISNYPISKDSKNFYQELADEGMKYLLENKIEKDDAWYWNYYPELEESVENYGVHVAYTIDGLLMYKTGNGRLSSEIDEQKILNGFKLYIVDGDILEMFSIPEREPRLWDLGYFLYVASKYFSEERVIVDIIYSEISSRQEDEGFRLYKKEDSPLNLVRHNAHVLLGLSKYFWNN
jgi:hypothetical protein